VFDLSESQLARVRTGGAVLLVAEGIETNATISVNGKTVVSTDDSWLTYETPPPFVNIESVPLYYILLHSVILSCQAAYEAPPPFVTSDVILNICLS
jgi:hypothetical protein